MSTVHRVTTESSPVPSANTGGAKKQEMAAPLFWNVQNRGNAGADRADVGATQGASRPSQTPSWAQPYGQGAQARNSAAQPENPAVSSWAAQYARPSQQPAAQRSAQPTGAAQPGAAAGRTSSSDWAAQHRPAAPSGVGAGDWATQYRSAAPSATYAAPTAQPSQAAGAPQATVSRPQAAPAQQASYAPSATQASAPQASYAPGAAASRPQASTMAPQAAQSPQTTTSEVPAWAADYYRSAGTGSQAPAQQAHTTAPQAQPQASQYAQQRAAEERAQAERVAAQQEAARQQEAQQEAARQQAAQQEAARQQAVQRQAEQQEAERRAAAERAAAQQQAAAQQAATDRAAAERAAAERAAAEQAATRQAPAEPAAQPGLQPAAAAGATAAGVAGAAGATEAAQPAAAAMPTEATGGAAKEAAPGEPAAEPTAGRSSKRFTNLSFLPLFKRKSAQPVNEAQGEVEGEAEKEPEPEPPKPDLPQASNAYMDPRFAPLARVDLSRTSLAYPQRTFPASPYALLDPSKISPNVAYPQVRYMAPVMPQRELGTPLEELFRVDDPRHVYLIDTLHLARQDFTVKDGYAWGNYKLLNAKGEEIGKIVHEQETPTFVWSDGMKRHLMGGKHSITADVYNAQGERVIKIGRHLNVLHATIFVYEYLRDSDRPFELLGSVMKHNSISRRDFVLNMKNQETGAWEDVGTVGTNRMGWSYTLRDYHQRSRATVHRHRMFAQEGNVITLNFYEPEEEERRLSPQQRALLLATSAFVDRTY